jgi:hypothetical protein
MHHGLDTDLQGDQDTILDTADLAGMYIMVKEVQALLTMGQTGVVLLPENREMLIAATSREALPAGLQETSRVIAAIRTAV